MNFINKTVAQHWQEYASATELDCHSDEREYEASFYAGSVMMVGMIVEIIINSQTRRDALNQIEVFVREIENHASQFTEPEP